MKIIQAKIENLHAVAELFDLYRQFYGQAADIDAAKEFIRERLTLNDATILLALTAKNLPVGFTQLYPAFSSVAMKPMLYLNDLFVVSTNRKSGVGAALLNAAYDFALNTGAGSLKLATAVDNFAAKSLYESNAYLKVTAFDHYVRKVDS
ncbi:GNAT family N-acetyltransferase [Aliiglaciecola sp. 3_MG-2023]|uniref:GNAT family N-acetyltransferase n=1 Tax=Aliiglaciecola sp. 3_MG-2023 TaxID=3062644 RepID=UPI0026E18B2A|nr:GNAT family N-acetyltransferase [Aliiglaciecola sp. 3_MG-2023]MDO6692658.1 GNAT family N-acetyltransferase [Aliiglaciecola sp. 3_MG-2023]